MATKLVIGKSAPKSFPMKVEVPTPHGPCEINFEAKYLPSTEWAKLREDHAEAISKATQGLFDAAKVEATRAYTIASQNAPKVATTEEEREKEILALMKPIKGSELETLKAKFSGELISKIVTHWDLDDTISVASLTEMCDQYPGSAEAVFKAYNETREGTRTKN